MNHITMEVFNEALKKLVQTLQDQEMKNIKEASKLCYESMKDDGVVHIFGSGHSVGFGMECTGRPGSLVPFHMIETSDFVTKGLYSLAEFNGPDNIFERRPNIADKLYDLYDIRPQDVFIIISNSGINGLVIDLVMDGCFRQFLQSVFAFIVLLGKYYGEIHLVALNGEVPDHIQGDDITSFGKVKNIF